VVTKMKEFDIILTADRSVMNSFHMKWRLGTLTWNSTDWIPPSGFKLLAGKPKHKNGEPTFAPLSLRTLEGTLQEKGYSVKVVLPEYIDRYLSRTRAVGISTQDPLGEAFSPVYLHMLCREHKISHVEFLKLIYRPALQRARKNGLKLIVGGPGSWQLNHGIKGMDCIVGGESENILPALLDKVRKGESLPKTIQCQRDQSPNPSDIAPISKPSQFGLLQVGRGCPKRCKFCTVSGKPFWFSLDHLEKQVRVNHRAGLQHVQLVSEDLLLYGSKGIRPELKKFQSLISLMAKYSKFISLSHFSISAIVQEPRLYQEIHHHWPEEQKFATAQTGIETGSERVLKNISPAKKAPVKNMTWREMVLMCSDIMAESKVFPYYTVLIGGPFETPDDSLKTLELLDEIKDTRSLFLPCLYTSEDRPHPEVKDLRDIEKEVIGLSIRHNMKWYDHLSDKMIDLRPGNRFVKKRFRDVMLKVLYGRLKNGFDEADCDINSTKIIEKTARSPVQEHRFAHQNSI
jgi:radical SAM superfamily enzyme YgiQ (UPF0313 family)